MWLLLNLLNAATVDKLQGGLCVCSTFDILKHKTVYLNYLERGINQMGFGDN